MKNFKKVLALVLAVATLLSFATIASAATSASYKDAAAIEKNGQTEAVDVLSYIGVLAGYPDKNFKADNEITRAEAAKIIAMFDNGSVDISTLYTSANPFTDVKGNWAESYVAYGYKAGIIAGVGKLLFAPNAKLTGVQFLKMVLVVLGYDAKAEGLEGPSWAVNTLYLAKKAGLLKGLGDKFDAAANLLRGQAAQIMLNALKAYKIEYGQVIDKEYTKEVGTLAPNGYKYITVAGAIETNKLLADDWSLKCTDLDDAFMRPGHEWTKSGKVIGDYWDTPVATYTTKTSNCTMLVDLGYAKTDKTAVKVAEYLNGGKVNGDATVAYNTGYDITMQHDNASKTPACEHKFLHTAQGTLTEVYEMGTNMYRVVEVETFLANVANYKAQATTNAHTTAGLATLNLHLEGADSTKRAAQFYNLTETTVADQTATTNNITAVYNLMYESDSFVKGDQVLVTYSVKPSIDITKALTAKIDGSYNVELGIQSVTLAKSSTSTLNGFTTEANTDPSTTKIDSTWTPDAAKFFVGYDYTKIQANVPSQRYFYYDIYGNVIGSAKVVTTNVYNVIDTIWRYGAESDGLTNIKITSVGMDGKIGAATPIASVTNNTTITPTALTFAGLTDEAENGTVNKTFYNRIYTYTMTAKGAFEETVPETTTLASKEADKSYTTTDAQSVLIKAKDSNVRIVEDQQPTQNIAVDNNTIFLVNEGDHKYTSYTGKDAITTDLSAVHAEIIFSDTGYAKIVYLYGDIQRAGDNTTAYIAKPESFKTELIDDVTYDLYTAYVDGKETVVRVKQTASTPTLFDGAYLEGFYNINFTSPDGVVVADITRIGVDYANATTITNTKNTGKNAIYTITNHSFGDKDKTTATITITPAMGTETNLNVTAATKVYLVNGKTVTAGKVSDIVDTTTGTTTITDCARIVLSTTGTNNVDTIYLMQGVYTTATGAFAAKMD